MGHPRGLVFRQSHSLATRLVRIALEGNGPSYWAVPRRPTDEEVGFLQTLADATALALANVELYEGLKAALAKEQVARTSAEEALDRLRRSDAAREAALRQAETANRAKDEFLMLLSHELHTPLMPLLGWARVLRASTPDPDALSRGLAAIERNARAELDLVNKLLDVSEMTAGKIEIERRPIDVLETAQMVLKSFTKAAEAKGIRIEQLGSR